MSPFPDPLTAPLDLQRQLTAEAESAAIRGTDVPERLLELETVDVGQTPHEVVYRENKLELLHYEPSTADQRDEPLLLVYALINRPFILDLQPDKSVVRQFLDHGFDVYLINWHEPSALDRRLSLAHYIDVYVDNCVDVVRRRASRDAIDILGYCMGGTMSVMYAALHPERVRNLLLLATGLCFDGEAGVLEDWSVEYDPEAVVDAFGNVPAEFLATGFAAMNPVTNYVTKYVQLYRRLEDGDYVENFARMERWLREGVDLAGETYIDFLEDLYQADALAEDDLAIGGTDVDIQHITMPVLQIVGEFDNLVPPSASKPFNDLIPSEDTEIMEFSSGHVGLAVSDMAHAELWPAVCAWLEDRT